MLLSYPERPSGGQVHAYLYAYALWFGLLPRIRFRVVVLAMRRRSDRSGWSVPMRRGIAAEDTEHFDLVVVATGQFSRSRIRTLPGEDAFLAAGGKVHHSSGYAGGRQGLDRDVARPEFRGTVTPNR